MPSVSAGPAAHPRQLRDLLAICHVGGISLRRSARRLKVVATSREALGISGEVIWNVAPLALPASLHLDAGRIERRGIRSSCLSKKRPPSCPSLRSMPEMPRRWRKSAGPWTACRLRLNSPRHARRSLSADGAGPSALPQGDLRGLRRPAGRKRLGSKKWRETAFEAIEELSAALGPDYVVLGGGNAKKLGALPENTKLGANENAFLGGFRLWIRRCRRRP